MLFLWRGSGPVRHKEHRTSEVEFSAQHRSWTFPEFHPPTDSILCRMSLSEGNKWMAFLRLKTFLSPHSRDAAQAERGCSEEWKCTWEKFSLAFVLQWSSLHHFYEYFYQLLLSDITPMAKSDLSSFLCPNFIYFGLINGLYTDLELILTGFLFFLLFRKMDEFIYIRMEMNFLPITSLAALPFKMT